MFSLEQLLFSVASDARTNIEILETVLPMLKEVCEREKNERQEIKVRQKSAIFSIMCIVHSMNGILIY